MGKRFIFLERNTFPWGDSNETIGWYILCFRIGRFRFKWFTECGEWFAYLTWEGKRRRRIIRLSSAGCYSRVVDYV